MKLNNSRKRLLENTASMAITQIATYVMPLISLPYLSRILGIEKFGLVFWAISLVQYFVIFSDFGFSFSSIRDISVNRDDEKKLSEIFSNILFAKIILLLIGLIIFSAIVFSIPNLRDEKLLFYLSFTLVIGNVLYPAWFFQGIEHMKYITAMNITTKALFLLFIFLFIRKPEDYLFVALFNSLGYAIPAILGIRLALKKFKVKIIIPKFSQIVQQLKSSFGFFIAVISTASSANSFFLGLLCGPTAAGYYIASEKIYQAINGLQIPLTSALYPYIAKNKDIQLFMKIFKIAMLIIIPLAIIICIFAKDIIILFYGQEMAQGYKVLKIMSFTLILAFLSGLIGYPFLGGMGHPKEVNMSSIISFVLQIILLFILITSHHFTLITAALLTIVSEGFMLSMRAYAIKKYNLGEYNGSKIRTA